MKKKKLSFLRFVRFIFLKVTSVFVIIKNKKTFSSEVSTSVLISHKLGGGTEQFVQNFLKEHQDENILVIRNCSYIRDLYFQLENRKGEILTIEKSFSELFLKISNVRCVYLNSLVSYRSVYKILDFLTLFKSTNPEIKLLYFLHDFHCICPGFNLIEKNQYCELNCENNKCNFDSSVYSDFKSINLWQKKWFNFLKVTDEVRSFDVSGKLILSKKYPLLNESSITIKPHKMDYCNLREVKSSKNPFIIGVVGTIVGIPKGEKIVEDLIIKAREENVKVVMIGKYKKKLEYQNVFYTGPYKIENLSDIIEREKISVIFFPSIWPETFSFLVSELIQTNIPVLGFNIGAQGTKLLKYSHGYTIDTKSSIQNVFDKLKEININEK